MNVYSIDKGKTHFSQDFKQVFCSFSYRIIDSPDDHHPKYFGAFVADIDWAGYFSDRVIARYLQTTEDEPWLYAMEPDTAIVNDLFYNKLIEYMSLAKGKFGAAIEIDDKEINEVSDEVDEDAAEGNVYTEEQEVAIFNEMFNNADFIEEFKDELDNPAKFNLLTAIMYFQKNAPIAKEPEGKQSTLKKYLQGE